jgi:SAM-dependent methyltransferase
VTDLSPLRAAFPSAAGEVGVLAELELRYADGAEKRLLELFLAADDLSSTNEELINEATNWPERYHLDPARGNVIRGLDFRAGARVLEVGSGCGAITRALGELGLQVDAIEPEIARARVGAARTRDLPDVRVFAGSLADVPSEPSYDAVVVVGVLEYVADGSADLAGYRDFLEQIRLRLAPNGHLILAIENKLGVKYQAGAPEDHTGRVADGIESYLREGNRARTFSRRELEDLLGEAGFRSTTLGAFPDYKLPRVVMDVDALLDADARLAERLPDFPSPAHAGTVVPFADEGGLWRSWARAGAAREVPNSFLVIACVGEQTLWPSNRLAVTWTVDRRPPFAVERRIEREGSKILVRSTAANPAPSRDPGRLNVRREATEEVVAGRDLVDLIAESLDLNGAVALLAHWIAEVDARAGGGVELPVALVPGNVIVTDHGIRTVALDVHAVATRGALLRRGLFLLADELVRRRRVPAWLRASTVLDVAEVFRSSTGLPADWFDTFVGEEAQLRASLFASPYARDAEAAFHDALSARAAESKDGRARLAEQLSGSEAGRASAVQSLAEAEARDLANRRELRDRTARIRKLRSRLDQKNLRIRELRSAVPAPGWRSRLRRVLRRS